MPRLIRTGLLITIGALLALALVWAGAQLNAQAEDGLTSGQDAGANRTQAKAAGNATVGQGDPGQAGGGQVGSANGTKAQAKKPARFTRDDQGIITDSQTGLQWYFSSVGYFTWDKAKSWTEELKVGGGGWRMPRRSELAGLRTERQGGWPQRKAGCWFDPIFLSPAMLRKGSCGWVWSGEAHPFDEPVAETHPFKGLVAESHPSDEPDSEVPQKEAWGFYYEGGYENSDVRGAIAPSMRAFAVRSRPHGQDTSGVSGQSSTPVAKAPGKTKAIIQPRVTPHLTAGRFFKDNEDVITNSW